MTLNELTKKYKTLVGIEVLEIKKVKESIYILIRKNYQGGLFSTISLELNIRQNIDQYFPGMDLKFIWLFPDTNKDTYILAPGYIFHLTETLLISRIEGNRAKVIYIHGKKRIHFKRWENIVRGDLLSIGKLEFAGFDLGGMVPDLAPIDTDSFFCLTPIPCIARIDSHRVFFRHIFDTYTIPELDKQTLKILSYEQRTNEKQTDR